MSRYIFRGAVFDEHPVLQPSVTAEQELATGTLSLDLWGNIDLDSDRVRDSRLNEIVPTVDWSASLAWFDLSLGATFYEYPSDFDDGTLELYTIVAYDELDVTPALEIWRDVDEVDGTYFSFNLSRDFELSETWSLSALAGVGWMDRGQAESNFGVRRSGWSDWLLQAAFTRALTDHLALDAIVGWTSVLDRDLRDSAEDPDNLVFTLGVSYGL